MSRYSKGSLSENWISIYTRSFSLLFGTIPTLTPKYIRDYSRYPLHLRFYAYNFYICCDLHVIFTPFLSRACAVFMLKPCHYAQLINLWLSARVFGDETGMWTLTSQSSKGNSVTCQLKSTLKRASPSLEELRPVACATSFRTHSDRQRKSLLSLNYYFAKFSTSTCAGNIPISKLFRVNSC